MKVKYSRFRHNAKQPSFTSPTGPRRQGGEQEHAQYPTNDDVTSGWSCRRPENVSILSSLVRFEALSLSRLLVAASRLALDLFREEKSRKTSGTRVGAYSHWKWTGTPSINFAVENTNIVRPKFNFIQRINGQENLAIPGNNRVNNWENKSGHDTHHGPHATREGNNLTGYTRDA